MIKELGDLNEKFYVLYGRLDHCKKLLSLNSEQVKFMASALFDQYKAEYKLLLMRAEIKEKRALYDAELRHDVLVPRKRFFLFRNRAMKQLDNEILSDTEKWFAERDKAFNEGSNPCGSIDNVPDGRVVAENRKNDFSVDMGNDGGSPESSAGADVAFASDR